VSSAVVLDDPPHAARRGSRTAAPADRAPRVRRVREDFDAGFHTILDTASRIEESR
jgi:hypothetical protein